MLQDIKIFVGLILIVVSFVYILRRPGVSMIESLLQERQKKMEKLQAQQEQLQAQQDHPENQEDK